MDIQPTSSPSYSRSIAMNPDSAKILAMLTLGGGCLLVGLLPAFINRTRRRRRQFSVSAMLCFGAGVLLSTSLVHMLPEVRENLGSQSETVFCLGFFIVYIVDELVHACFGEAIRHNHEGGRSRERRHSDSDAHEHSHQQNSVRPPSRYGSGEETRTLLDRYVVHIGLAQGQQRLQLEFVLGKRNCIGFSIQPESFEEAFFIFGLFAVAQRNALALRHTYDRKKTLRMLRLMLEYVTLHTENPVNRALPAMLGFCARSRYTHFWRDLQSVSKTRQQRFVSLRAIHIQNIKKNKTELKRASGSRRD